MADVPDRLAEKLGSERGEVDPLPAYEALLRLLAIHKPVDRGRVLPCCDGCESECCASPARCHDIGDCAVRTTIRTALKVSIL